MFSPQNECIKPFSNQRLHITPGDLKSLLQTDALAANILSQTHQASKTFSKKASGALKLAKFWLSLTF